MKRIIGNQPVGATTVLQEAPSREAQLCERGHPTEVDTDRFGVARPDAMPVTVSERVISPSLKPGGCKDQTPE